MKKLFMELHKDETGSESIEQLLIIAAIVLPLLGLLIWFRGEIGTWASDKWSEITGKGKNVGFNQ